MPSTASWAVALKSIELEWKAGFRSARFAGRDTEQEVPRLASRKKEASMTKRGKGFFMFAKIAKIIVYLRIENERTMKKFLRILLALAVVLVLAVLLVWQGEIRTLSTVKQVGGNPYLYTMEFKASYDLDEVVEKEVDTNAELLDYVISRVGKGLPIKISSSQVADENGELKTFSCTSFQVKKPDGKGYWYGRNYDYFKNPTLVTFSHPRNGYASIGVSDMSHIGYGLDKLPTSFLKKINCMAAIYAPVDGINEKGLCTSIMALPRQASRQDTERKDVGTTMISL